MFVFGNFLNAAAWILHTALTVYMWIVIGAVIVSWVSADPYNPIVRFLYQATEPVFYQVRRVLPISGFGLDFSPLIVILGIVFIQRFVVRSLFDMALRMR